MKKSKVVLFIAAILALALLSMQSHAKSNDIYVKPISMDATAYCDQGITASGEYVRIGICAAKKEYIGKTAIVYSQENGKVTGIIGIYEIKDTGGHELIKAGKCIDIYMERYETCKQFGRQKVLVQIVDAVG